MNGLLNILELARERVAAGKPLQLFWPSSIAAFGPNTPRINVPQFTVMDPTTMYGISKLAGERLCEYYFTKYAVDVRSLRYPGLIGYQAPPGGGTTDYAIEMFYAAARKEIYKAPLSDTTVLPMMYMPDALRAAIELMRASPQAIRIRSSYNIAAMSFTPMQLAMHIQRHYPEFKVRCCPDHRQDIADSWPDSIDDTQARSDWHWRHHFDLAKMVDDMLGHIKS
jgi:nucleoside-diphosphate-sugar epimerase